MRAKLVVMLMALGLFLATATAHASLIDLTVFTTEVQANKTAQGTDGVSYVQGSYYPTIGSYAVFGANDLDMTVTADNFTLNLHTNYDPDHQDAHGSEVGDLFFIVDDSYYAFDLSNWDDQTAGFYAGIDTKTSSEVFRDGANSGYIFGFDYRITGTDDPFGQAIVRRDGGTYGYAANVVRSGDGTGIQPYYTYTISGSFNLFEALGLTYYGQTFDVIWAPTCGNSVLWARGTLNGDPPGGNVIPEPGTIALLGLGLVGLFWGRKRFFSK